MHGDDHKMLSKILDAEDARLIFFWTFITMLVGMTFGKGNVKFYYLLIGGLTATTAVTLIFKLLIRPAIKKRS